MSINRTNQDGFGAVEIIIVCSVLVVLGLVGVAVLRGNHKNPIKTATTPAKTETQTSQQPTSTAAPAQTATQYLVIKEWGVKLTLNSDTSSLYYYIKPNLPDVAYLSLKTISDVAPNCAADKFSLGAIFRLTPAEQQSAVSDPTKGIPGSTQIGDYWYGYTKSQAACTDGSTSMNDAFSKAAPNYNASTLKSTFDTISAN